MIDTHQIYPVWMNRIGYHIVVLIKFTSFWLIIDTHQIYPVWVNRIGYHIVVLIKFTSFWLIGHSTHKIYPICPYYCSHYICLIFVYRFVTHIMVLILVPIQSSQTLQIYLPRLGGFDWYQHYSTHLIYRIMGKKIQWRIQRGCGGSLEPHSLPPLFKYPIKMK